jgi:hypothetical protein
MVEPVGTPLIAIVDQGTEPAADLHWDAWLGAMQRA